MKEKAFAAVYSDFRLLKTRSVAQIVLEVSVERALEVLTILDGAPNPGAEKWVGVAVLEPKDMNRDSLEHTVIHGGKE